MAAKNSKTAGTVSPVHQSVLADAPETRKFESLVGRKFGRLLVQEYAGRSRHNHILWTCLKGEM